MWAGVRRASERTVSYQACYLEGTEASMEQAGRFGLTDATPISVPRVVLATTAVVLVQVRALTPGAQVCLQMEPRSRMGGGVHTAAKRYAKEDRRQAATERADRRRAKTNNWSALEDRARQALASERRRQGIQVD
jgi:hypothetical protein